MENALIRSAILMNSDESLIRRMASGDEEALRSLYAAYGRRMFTYALRLTGNQAIAEEVLQDSLLAAWKGASGFRGEARLLTWLLGIVHRQALNATRRKRLPTAELIEAADAPDGDPGPERSAEAGERRRVMARAIGSLSTAHRTALELVFYQGLSLAEVAEVCACPVGTVKSRLNNPKAHLRKALDEAGLRAEDLL
ncbi:MAG: RNA polymerase sigma factor [Chloroflexota bacterium]